MRFNADWQLYNEIDKKAGAFFKKSQQFNMPFSFPEESSLVNPEVDSLGLYWLCFECKKRINQEDIREIENFKKIKIKEFIDSETTPLTKEKLDVLISKIVQEINKFDVIIEDRFGRQVYDFYDALKEVLKSMLDSISFDELTQIIREYEKTIVNYGKVVNIYNKLKLLFNYHEFVHTYTGTDDPEGVKKQLFGLEHKALSIINEINNELQLIVGKSPQEEITITKEAPICGDHDMNYYCDFPTCDNFTLDNHKIFLVESFESKLLEKIIKTEKSYQYCENHAARCESCGDDLAIYDAVDENSQKPVFHEEKWYHSKCYNDNFTSCDECNSIVDRESALWKESTQQSLCQDCYVNDEEDSIDKEPDFNEAKKLVHEIKKHQGSLYPLDASIIIGNILPTLISAHKKFGNIAFDPDSSQKESENKALQSILSRIQKPEAKAAVETELQTNGIEGAIKTFQNNIIYQTSMKEKYPTLKGYRPLPVNVAIESSDSHSGMVVALYPSDEMLAWANKSLPGAANFYQNVLAGMGHHSGALGYARLSESNGNLLIDNLQTDIDKQSKAISNYEKRLIEKVDSFEREITRINYLVQYLHVEHDNEIIKQHKVDIKSWQEKSDQAEKILTNYNAYVVFWTNAVDKFWAPYLLDTIKQYAKAAGKKAYLTSYDMQVEKWPNLPKRNKDVYDRLPDMMGMAQDKVYVKPESLSGKEWLLKRVANYCDKFYKLAIKRKQFYV